MICPKCRFDNPDGTMFCEECDHRLDQPYRKKKKIKPLYFLAVAFVLGVFSAMTGAMDVKWFIPVPPGALGLLLGAFSLTVIRIKEDKNRQIMMVFAIAALAFSAVGFMLGIGKI